ncbi:MAG: hypothetical protein ACTSRK_07885 [Promethearchaeota archaeon]
MHGFLHIMLIGAKSGNIITSYDNFSLDNPYFDLDFMEILKEQGILLNDPDWLENTTEIQIQLENLKYPLVYHFAHNDSLILVVVGTSHAPQIIELLERLLEDLELDFIPKYTKPPIFLVSEISDTLNGSGIQKNSQPQSTDSLQPPNEKPSKKSKKAIKPKKSKKSKNSKNNNNEIQPIVSSTIDGDSTSFNPLENEDIGSPNEDDVQKFDFLFNLAQSMSEYLLPCFLIPEKRIEISEHLTEPHVKAMNFIRDLVQEKYSLDFDNQIWQKVDGTWTLREFADIHSIEIKHLREIMFFLWKSEIITLRLPYEKWDIFRATIKAPLFLDEGSTENLMLIGRYNSSKIIQLLAYIGEGCSYLNLVNNFDFTKTKLSLYLSELLQRQIILRKEYKPVMAHIPEDLIPLLTMQGFTKSDFAILIQLAHVLDGSKSLQSTALDLKIDPNHLKVLLDKYETAIKIIT